MNDTWRLHDALLVADSIVLEVLRMARDGRPMEKKYAAQILEKAELLASVRRRSEVIRKLCGG